MTQRVGIVGGSMAGLLAARVLSELGWEVTIYERDAPSDVPALRKSVPQAAHPHVLLAKGAELLMKWFPDLFASMEQQGAVSGDMSAASNWFHFGTWKRRLDSGVHVHFQSRLLLEHEVRKRVLATPGVTLRHAAVQGASFAEESSTIQLDTGEESSFDLLVDASGKGSRLGAWLREGDFDEPRQEKVIVNVSYTSARFRPTVQLDFQGLLIYPTPPAEQRAGGILPVEGGEALVSCFGWCGQKAEPNLKGMISYARTLPQPEIAQFLEHAELTSAIQSFQYKEARRVRIDQVGRFPARLCVLGDALCSVDPVFGQGMTLACLQAEELGWLLRQSPSDPSKAARRFRKTSVRATETAWMLSTGEDFRYSDVEGERPWGLALSHWYTEKVHRLTALDEQVYRRFARVMNLQSGPAALFHPSVVARVLYAGLRPPPRVQVRPQSTRVTE